MEILKVTKDEVSGLISITFNPEEILAAKAYFKSLFDDNRKDDTNYSTDCNNPGCENGCTCNQKYPEPTPEFDNITTYYSEPPTAEYRDPAMEETISESEPPKDDTWQSPSDFEGAAV